ncbi:permease of the major facilitator superfamily [Penicillium taxi]|uniref:permease of the major facilitator superfamily n=1 Tax=Penicillium taxi TaxID=168475 RepID=UPI002544ECFC|nr:permease of the major facilitator superfamily [Penicillium taxi]KAJ5888728.1 permease of the major facilitator superfamily [Penicillium taxi]
MAEPKMATIIAQQISDESQSTSFNNEKMSEEPKSFKTIAEKYADATLRFVEENEHCAPLTLEEEKKVQRKLYLHVVFLVFVINLVLFIDKSTLSYASILGLYEGTHIDDTKYNNLNTIFYVGYTVSQWPGNYLLQRLPFGKFIATTILTWSILIFLHCAASSYGGLIVLRFFLGAVESVVVPALEMTLGMFFTRKEQSTIQPIFWIACMGANIPAGFIGYGLLFTHSTVLPWKFFMIITGGLTLILSVYSWFFYPNNPAEAWFLTLPEKFYAVKRVHDSTQSSIEQKQFKKSQFIETLRDPVSWLFGLQTFTLMLSNNLAYQQNLLFVSLGVSNLGSTLVSVASGGFSVICCIIAAVLLKLFPGKIAYWGTFWCIPAVAGGIGMVALPWSNKLGLLACLILAGGTFGITYILSLGWTSSSASGYTKKLTRNVIFMIAYGIANIVSPQIWTANAAPRYYAAWIAQIVISWVGTPAILLLIRFILVRRNRERAIWVEDQHKLGFQGEGYVERIDGGNDGHGVVKAKVDQALLDLTDMENKYFVYPL